MSCNGHLQLFEATSINGSLDLLPTLNNLSELESTEGHLAEAEPHLRRPLAIVEKIADKASVHAAAQLDNRSLRFLLEQKFFGAEELMRRALLISTAEALYRSRGPDQRRVKDLGKIGRIIRKESWVGSRRIEHSEVGQAENQSGSTNPGASYCDSGTKISSRRS